MPKLVCQKRLPVSDEFLWSVDRNSNLSNLVDLVNFFFRFLESFCRSILGGRWEEVPSASRDLKVAARFGSRNIKNDESANEPVDNFGPPDWGDVGSLSSLCPAIPYASGAFQKD